MTPSRKSGIPFAQNGCSMFIWNQVPAVVFLIPVL